MPSKPIPDDDQTPIADSQDVGDGSDSPVVEEPVVEAAVSEPAEAPAPVDIFATIAGVQIFRAGTWNGERYTTRDIDNMIAAAAEVGYRPPVKLGHTQDPGAPAYGYAVNLRRDGDVLIADFEDVPDDLVSQIRAKRYDAVSSEIYLGMKRDLKTYPKALKAVAVLGAHPPAVANLKPLSEALAGLSEYSSFVSIDMTPVPQAAPESTTMTDKAADQTTTPAPATDPAVAQMQQELAQMREQMAAAQAKADAASTSQLTIQRLQETVRASDLALKQIHEQGRQSRIEQLVKSVLRPSWRGHIGALAELATRGETPGSEPQTVNFQAAGADEASPTPALSVIEDLVRMMNADVSELYTEQVRSGNIARKFSDGIDDPGTQLFAIVADYCRAHPEVKSDEARRRVMTDPKHAALVKRYNSATVGMN